MFDIFHIMCVNDGNVKYGVDNAVFDLIRTKFGRFQFYLVLIDTNSSIASMTAVSNH